MNKASQISTFDLYVLRTPILSFEKVSQLTIERIKILCREPIISEAIYIASPELHGEMLKLINNERIKNERKLVITLLKYLLRMGNRATPFGLFSGCSVGEIKSHSSIILNPALMHKRTTRLDMNYLCALSQKLEENKKVRDTLKFYPNNSLYKIGTKLRYIEFKYEKTLRRHFTVSIDDSEYISMILNHSRKGAIIDELANLIDEPDVTHEEAVEFIHELIDNQVLVSSISPHVTGEDYFNSLSKNISNKNDQAIFSNIQNALNKINSSPLGDGFYHYNELYEAVEEFEVEYKKKFLLQTDLTSTFQTNTLDKKLVTSLDNAIVALNKLTNFQENESLNKFKKEFYDTYEDEEIPLAFALDVETGIGYATNDKGSYDISPLIDDLSVHGDSNTRNGYTDIKWNRRDGFLNRKMIEAIKNKSYEINITDDDLKDFTQNWEYIPDTFSAFINILDNQSDQPKILLSNIGNITASSILGRFCHSDQKIKKLVDEIIIKENALSNVVYAEIAHLPEKRTGNVLFRPHLRSHEIPYLAKSNLPEENQINIEDLMISVKSNRIVLRSKKLNKEVIPRLATAHNYTNNSLPIYQFLGDMQGQGLNEYMTFTWGNVYIFYDFFPRINYKNTVLATAQWVIRRKILKTLVSRKSINAWLEKEKIPKKVLLADDDNQLLIDFEHELSIEMFISIIRNKEEIILIEYLFDSKSSIVKDVSGKPFSHEIILSYFKNKN